MESKEELKETDVKNCMCYYFNDIMWDLNIDLELNIYWTKT